MTSGLTVNIYGVWGSSATNVFAVGDSGNIRKYDGSTWSAMTSGTTKRLRDVWGSAANNVIAVGEDGTIRKYNGTSWGSMTSGTTLTLQGVWGSSATNIFAVGGAKENQSGSAIIQKYNGTAWSNNYLPIPQFHDSMMHGELLILMSMLWARQEQYSTQPMAVQTGLQCQFQLE